jgi:hypothetical protein
VRERVMREKEKEKKEWKKKMVEDL